MKTLETGEAYFDKVIPECEDGHVRIIMKRGYHYFQKIDENTTRYMNISNSDP